MSRLKHLYCVAVMGVDSNGDYELCTFIYDGDHDPSKLDGFDSDHGLVLFKAENEENAELAAYGSLSKAQRTKTVVDATLAANDRT